MEIEIKVPGFPESVSDGSVVGWHKKIGEQVKRDEIIVDIETDKVMFEVPAPGDGILKSILQTEGSTVVSGQPLAVIETDAASAVNDELGNIDSADKDDSLGEVIAVQAVAGDKQINAGPAARKLMMENKLAGDVIHGSGKGGRILKEDVVRYLDQHREVDNPVVTMDRPVHDVLQSTETRDKRVPMTRLRARIAQRLVEAQHTAAMLTTFNEINMRPVMVMREKYRDQFEKEHNVRLGFMSFFVKAVTESLKRFPVINASVDGQEIVYHSYFDIGIAVSSPRGLVVPILRNADQMSLAEIEGAIRAYAQKANEGGLSLEEITGGTFTITNGGTFGSMLSTPILNPPQSAILGMHKIQERAVVENGEIVARPVMYVALTYDHRIIDGREAVQFLVSVKEQIEDPSRMLLGI